jgi:hypothetical protein
MNQPVQATRIEPRWPPALAILAVLFLLEVLPARIRLMPVWVPYLVATVILVPMAAVAFAPVEALWLRLERGATFLFFAMTGILLVATTAHLIRSIVFRPGEISAIPLLSSSIALWATNMFTFSLLYWRIDRGGPDARVNNLGIKPDWLFPQAGVPEAVPADWRPSFVDYLFLGYSTATAFTDALPLTSRAKILMMLESTISLVTVLVAASRAISILR